MSLIIMDVKYGTIDTDDSSCHGYYIIKFSLSLYTLISDLSIDGQVIYSGEMVCDRASFFPININCCYYVLQKTKSINTNFPLRKIINGSVSIIFYYFKDFIPPCLGSISQNDYNTLSQQHIPMKEHDNIMGENN